MATSAVPILYYGVQIATVPFYPGYSFLTNSASELGSENSSFPGAFNAGVIVNGIAALIAAPALFSALALEGVSRLWSWLVALALISMGVASIWAGSYALPDPRHNPGALGAGTFLIPLLLPLAVLRVEAARSLRKYLFFNLAVFFALVPVMSGLTAVDLHQFGGLLQRVTAAVVYLPVGVLGHWLLQRRGIRRRAWEAQSTSERG